MAWHTLEFHLERNHWIRDRETHLTFNKSYMVSSSPSRPNWRSSVWFVLRSFPIFVWYHPAGRLWNFWAVFGGDDDTHTSLEYVQKDTQATGINLKTNWEIPAHVDDLSCRNRVASAGEIIHKNYAVDSQNRGESPANGFAYSNSSTWPLSSQCSFKWRSSIPESIFSQTSAVWLLLVFRPCRGSYARVRAQSLESSLHPSSTYSGQWNWDTCIWMWWSTKNKIKPIWIEASDCPWLQGCVTGRSGVLQLILHLPILLV